MIQIQQIDTIPMGIQVKIDLAKFCKETREELGLTQEELAKKLKKTVRAISYWEHGERKPNGEIVLRLIELRDECRAKNGRREG